MVCVSISKCNCITYNYWWYISFTNRRCLNINATNFLVVGVSSFIQSWFGHRYPIADGPAGSWVSIFVILGQVAMHQGQSAKDVLQLLEGGLIISGILLFILGITGLVHRILRLFTL